MLLLWQLMWIHLIGLICPIILEKSERMKYTFARYLNKLVAASRAAKIYKHYKQLTLFKMGRRAKKALLTSFSIVTSTNIETKPQKLYFQLFFPRLCKILRPYLVPVLNYQTWANSTSQIVFFLSNTYKIEIMIKVPHRDARINKPWSHDHIYNIL